MLLAIQIAVGLIIGFAAIFAYKKRAKPKQNTAQSSAPDLSDTERSQKFQENIQAKIAELKKLQAEGADRNETEALIQKFQATAKFDQANLFLKNLILRSDKVQNEEVRANEHRELLALVKEIALLHEQGALATEIAKSFLSLADMQFKNEMKRLALKAASASVNN